MKKSNVSFKLSSLKNLFLCVLLAAAAVSCKEADGILDDILDDKDDKDEDKMEMVNIFASTNTGGNFTIFDVSDLDDVSRVVANTGSMDADGIYYDKHKDIVYQLSRTNSQINAYTDVSDLEGTTDVMADFSSTADFTSGREIAVSGNWLVAVDNATDANMFYVYKIEGSSIMLEKAYSVDFPLWGIAIDGSTLYAVQDISDSLAVYENFFDNPEGDIMPTQKVQVEGIVRTHGISYDAYKDIMILTDIGDATNAEDGGFQVIEKFTDKLMAAGQGGTIPLSDQVRVAGDKTYLGNPVDVTLDADNKIVYIAERANGGGRLLGFEYPKKSGNYKCVVNLDYEGASAVYASAIMEDYD